MLRRRVSPQPAATNLTRSHSHLTIGQPSGSTGPQATVTLEMKVSKGATIQVLRLASLSSHRGTLSCTTLAHAVDGSLDLEAESSRLQRQRDAEGLIVVTGVGWPGKLTAGLAKGLGWPGRRTEPDEQQAEPLPEPLAFLDVSRETARPGPVSAAPGEDERAGWSLPDPSGGPPSDEDGSRPMVQTLEPGRQQKPDPALEAVASLDDLEVAQVSTAADPATTDSGSEAAVIGPPAEPRPAPEPIRLDPIPDLHGTPAERRSAPLQIVVEAPISTVHETGTQPEVQLSPSSHWGSGAEALPTVAPVPQSLPTAVATEGALPVPMPTAPLSLAPVQAGSLHDFDDSTPLAREVAEETRRRLALAGRRFPRPAATRIITVANQKGGVGKTTTTVNLAAALAQSGLTVLVLDIDPQGNASTALGIDHHTEVESVYDVLVDSRPMIEVIKQCPDIEGLWCAPATIDLAGAEIELVSLVARETRLRRALDSFLADRSTGAPVFDYVLIDCPPSLGLLTVNAFVAAREVLIPIQCEYYALEGLSQLLRNVELIKGHLNPELRVSTILLTMYDGRTRLSAQVADEVRTHFPDQVLKTSVPRSVRISEAPSHGQTVMTYDAVSSGALSYLEAARELAEQVLGADDVSSGDLSTPRR
jgi:chromosome partitioning protein